MKYIKMAALFAVIINFIYVIEARSAVTFNDTAEDKMIISNTDYYEIAFSKTNGSVLYLKDLIRNKNVISGNSTNNLWELTFFSRSSITSSGYNNSAPSMFSYVWNSNDEILVLRYKPELGGADSEDIVVRIYPSEAEYIDMTIQLTNQWNDRMNLVNFPAFIRIDATDITSALIPVLPGVELAAAFFKNGRTWDMKYPGIPGMFSDIMIYRLGESYLGLYSIQDDSVFKPLKVELSTEMDTWGRKSTLMHGFASGISNGAVYNSARVRLEISDSYKSILDEFRETTGISSFSSLEDKLGEFYNSVIKSPVVKLNTVKLNLKFSEYEGQVYPLIPSPAVLHHVAFQQDGFDENNPDILPVDSKWGTTSDLANSMNHAKQSGFVIMPYSNPTWWDNESDTVNQLPSGLSIKDISVVLPNKNSLYESYSGKGGYVVSPYVSFVKERLATLMSDLTVTLPSDMVFEDQIGARQWIYDLNSSSPTPYHYINGWLEHTSLYSSKRLGTEWGFDRLAANDYVFFGSIFHWVKNGRTNSEWGDANWKIYPSAGMILRDKVMFYQHDLEDTTFSNTNYNIIWDLATGANLNYEFDFEGSTDTDWRYVNSALQSEVLSKYIDDLITGFEWTTALVSHTEYENWDVYANWSDTGYATVGEHGLNPYGFVIENSSGTILAGNFSSLYGYSLGTGNHYIIEIRENNTIRIMQPLGDDAIVQIPTLDSWNAQKKLYAYALLEDNSVWLVDFERNQEYVQFVLQNYIEGKKVRFYVLYQSFVDR